MKRRQEISGMVAALMMAVMLGGYVAAAADVYVAPQGAPDGDGSREHPYDLATALTGRGIAPGDRILLRGGQYDGPTDTNEKGLPRRLPFRPALSGTEAQPIVITSAPGESAHLNGYLHIENCEYLRFERLEIGDLEWDPSQTRFVHGPGVVWALASRGVAVVNCNLFGATQGTGLWRPALDFLLYGNLIHDHGVESFSGKPGGRGEGHSAYIQNVEGTKRLEHNICYRNYGWGIDIYTQQGEISGFDIIENIAYLASGLKDGQVGFNLGLTGWKPAERIRFIGNVAYQPRGPEQSWRSNMRLMFHKDPTITHGEAVVRDNYLMGSCRALVLSRWKSIEVTGNTLWARDYLMEISSAPAGSAVPESLPAPDLAAFTLRDNTYVDNGQAAPFIHGAHENALDAEKFSFAAWQALGLDAGSRLLPGRDGKPAGSRTFVFPNAWERGRANVAIFNWDGAESVDVDLSAALAAGQRYRIYNGLDVSQTFGRATPVLAGVFDGKPLAFPMKRDSRSPAFDAFVVLPEE